MRRRRGGLNFSHRRKKFNVELFKEILAWIIQIVAVILAAVVLVFMFGFRTSVVGNAMETTLLNGEQVLINRAVYTIGKPHSGDVVVFLPNGNVKSHYYIRRVIGTPGDTVQIIDGAVYVNQILYDEVTDVSAIEEAGIAASPIVLGTDEYFVLGDNRNNSEDSRYANIGVVNKQYIEGKAWFRFSGAGNMGFIR